MGADMEAENDHGTVNMPDKIPFAQVPHWITRSGKALSPGAKALYAGIMSYAHNTTRYAFPGRQRLADDLGVSLRSVGAYLKELEDFGAMAIVRGGRKKESGGFTTNEYTLAYAAPLKKHAKTREQETTSRREQNKHPKLDPDLTTLSTFTSEQDSEQMLHPRFTNRGDENKKSAGELADPISPAWYASEDRSIILSNIQAIARAKAAKDPVTAGHGVNQLHDNLCAAFNSDGDGLDGLIWDYNWEPKKPQATKLAAAIWLNQLLNEWQKETPITWRGA